MLWHSGVATCQPCPSLLPVKGKAVIPSTGLFTFGSVDSRRCRDVRSLPARRLLVPARCHALSRHGVDNVALDRLRATLCSGGASASPHAGDLSLASPWRGCVFGPRGAGAGYPRSAGDSTAQLSGWEIAALPEIPRRRNALRLDRRWARTPKEKACPGARDCGIIARDNTGLAGFCSAR
jgi:hypothetical protein